MPTIPGGSGKRRYVIRAKNDESAALSAFLDELSHDRSLELIDVIGPKGRPHTAVVQMSEDMAQALALRFQAANELMIEPDRPVSMFN